MQLRDSHYRGQNSAMTVMNHDNDNNNGDSSNVDIVYICIGYVFARTTSNLLSVGTWYKLVLTPTQ